MEDAAHILVVDDDTRIRELLSTYLRRKGFLVSGAPDAAGARERLSRMAFDLMVLDIMMPGEDGLALTRALRREGATLPIILLTARDQPRERVEGLAAGADDYMVKPFEPEELLFRINALLARRGRPLQPPRRLLIFGDCRFDMTTGELRRRGELIALTAREREILSRLAENAGRPVPRERLVPPGSSDNPRTVDVQINRLRRKIEADPAQPAHLQTVRGEGYVLLARLAEEKGP
jgi:two-component system phosphate regulon response regulator OmpR